MKVSGVGRRVPSTRHQLCLLLLMGLLAQSVVGTCAVPTLTDRIDSSLANAARCLIRHQSVDGAWRSETYGFFKDGPSLTPIVLSSLFFIPQAGRPVHTSYRKGVEYLVRMVREDGSIDTGPDGLSFPALTAASASRVVVLYDRTPKTLHAQASWLAYLRARQLVGKLGWQPSDPEFGGWGFSIRIPRKPAPGELKENFFESNMVATIFGIAALRSAKVPAEAPVYQEILTFVKRCQNFSDNADESDPKYDDGGFFFIPGDPVQNKAGVAGKDGSGRERFHSYGSMTADGLRALIRCGLPLDSPRVAAARKWLEANFSVKHVPGTYAPDREVLRDATYYYYCWAAAHAFAALELKQIETKNGRLNWAEALAKELMSRQRPDGSWSNRFTDAREDDPVLATAWAAAALAICRETITGEIKELVPRRGAAKPGVVSPAR